MHDIRLNTNLERTIAHSDELEEQLGDITFEKLTVPARVRLAGHRKTGKHKITQTKASVDHFVNFEGPAAIAVEVGHHDKAGDFVPGIHVLGRTVSEAEVTTNGTD